MRLATLACILLAAFAAGCGGDAAKAEETVSTAISGLSAGDAPRVCAQLTDGAKKELLVVLADNPLGFPDIKAKDCEDAITKLHAQLDKPSRAVLQDGEVDDAVVDGDTAKVHVTGAGMTLNLKKISDKWMITGGLFDG